MQGKMEKARQTALDMGVADMLNDTDLLGIVSHADRKIEVAGLESGYFDILIPDEIKNYLFRGYINAMSVATH